VTAGHPSWSTRSVAVPTSEGTDRVLPEDCGYTGTALRALEAATRLFADRGFYGTSVRDIGAAAGIRGPSLYEHFASKDEILAVLTTVGHRLIRDRLRHAANEEGDDPRAELAAVVRTLVTELCRWPELAIVANDELRALPPDLAEPPLTARDEVSILLADILQRGIDRGVFVERNIVLLVASIGSMCIRTPYWFAPSPLYTSAELARDYGELVVTMVSRAPA
jgi:AcrR family transcriptional regulator